MCGNIRTKKKKESSKMPRFLTEEQEKDMAQCSAKMIQINLYFGKQEKETKHALELSYSLCCFILQQYLRSSFI